ncbi:MAG: hypothetical protein MI862_14355 [Desulfobacterales bacterium]|nr:hypothetical protein [Desulfobacterales bacterium]
MPKYRIDMTFYSPMVYFFPPILDSIVLNLAYRSKKHTICCVNKPNGFFGPQIDYNEHYFDKYQDIPLTSRFITEHAEDFFDTWKKRWDTKHCGPVRWGRGKKQINVKQGKYRSYDMKMPAKAVKSGSFFFSGNGEKVMNLIDRYLFAIGKKRSMGFGIIDSADITEIDMDDVDILKLRPVPIKTAKFFDFDGQRLNAAYKPPYWLKQNITECIYHG